MTPRPGPFAGEIRGDAHERFRRHQPPATESGALPAIASTVRDWPAHYADGGRSPNARCALHLTALVTTPVGPEGGNASVSISGTNTSP